MLFSGDHFLSSPLMLMESWAQTIASAWLWMEAIETRSFLISELDTQVPSIVVSSMTWLAYHSLRLESLSRFPGVP